MIRAFPFIRRKHVMYILTRVNESKLQKHEK